MTSRPRSNRLAAWLRSRYAGARVVGVGHRVVHGGATYDGPIVVTPQVIDDLRALIPLAPLHQPYNLAAIEAVAERLPGVPQVACFDTSFHRAQPAVAELIPLPRDIRQGGVQRYGFHGLSYEYIASVLPEVAPEIADGRVIVAHLGSGASLCALRAGKSVDSTLGFTALDGLCMGTRPGAVDPGRDSLPVPDPGSVGAKEVETILYKKSGLLGDLRHQQRHARPARQRRAAAALAVDYFVYRAAKEIGALAAVLGGARRHWCSPPASARTPRRSASGSARRRRGSASTSIRTRTCGNGPRISRAGSRVSAWVIPTNEELMIARHTGALLGLSGRARLTVRALGV